MTSSSSSQTSAVYVAAVQARSGKSLVSLGLMELLSRRVDRLGYFRPVVRDDADHRIVLMRERYGLGPRVSWAMTDEQVDGLLAKGDIDEVFTRVIAAYRRLADECEYVVIEGTDQTGAHSPLELEFNARVASHLSASIVAVVNGGEHEPAEMGDVARAAVRAMVEDGARVAAVIANRVPPHRVDEFSEHLDGTSTYSAVVPDNTRLGMPSLGEVVTSLGAQVVHAGGGEDRIPVTSVKVAAMSLPNLLDRLTDGALVVAPGDRPDVLIGIMASRMSDAYPDVAGILLSGGFPPAPQVLRLLQGIGRVAVPIHAVDTDTWATVQAVAGVDAAITIETSYKIATALGLFEAHIDVDALVEAIKVSRSASITPLMFEFDLIERARADRRHIVLPEGTDPRIVEAAALLFKREVVDLTLLGAPDEVARVASAIGVDIDAATVVDPATSPDRERYATSYMEYRSHKGVVYDQAHDVMADVSYFATMMVQLGDADGMVSGAAHTTGHTIRPAFEFIKTRPGVDSVSSVFLMLLPDRVLVYGDCAVIPNPTPGQLADIAVSSAATARLFDIEPVVAMLSYSTGGSGAGEDVVRVREATKLARKAAPGLPIEGPIQYDAAIDVGIGRKKLPESSVAGRATVFVFPDLNTGNNTYKAVQRSAGAVAVGPILQGLNKPVNDLSRGATVADIVNTVAITAIQAQSVAGASGRN